jgi:hypothetical protein
MPKKLQDMDQMVCKGPQPRLVPSAESMKELVTRSNLTKEEKIELLGFEVSYGSTLGWTIDISTLPGQRGALLLRGKAAALSSQEVKTAGQWVAGSKVDVP